MSKRLLLAAGLIIALVVPSVAFGAVVKFGGSFPKDANASITFHVKRVNGKNKRVKDLSVRKFNVNCTKSGHEQLKTKPPITIDAAVRHRKWHFDDGTTSFEGTFRKADKNKAGGTLEVTARGIDLQDGNGPEDCHGGPRGFHAHT